MRRLGGPQTVGVQAPASVRVDQRQLLLPLPLGKLNAAVSTFPDNARFRNSRWNGLSSNMFSKKQVPFCDSRAKTKMKFQGSLPIIFISDFHFLYPAMSIKFAEACHCVCP